MSGFCTVEVARDRDRDRDKNTADVYVETVILLYSFVLLLED